MMVNDKLAIHFDARFEVLNLKAKLKILSSFVNNPKLMPSTKVKINDILVPLSIGREKIEDLKSQFRFEKNFFAQTKGKLLAIDANCLLCDYNFTNCERTLRPYVKDLELAQEVADLLVEQLA
jgi:hypothetical protein